MEEAIKQTTTKPSSPPKTATTTRTQVQRSTVESFPNVPKELLSDPERSDKMIRDHNIEVRLVIGPNTPTERVVQLKSVARAIKAHFSN